MISTIKHLHYNLPIRLCALFLSMFTQLNIHFLDEQKAKFAFLENQTHAISPLS